MTEEQEKALSAYNAASKKLQSGLGMAAGAAGAEAAYGMAYQLLVALKVPGFAQLRKKYRAS